MHSSSSSSVVVVVVIINLLLLVQHFNCFNFDTKLSIHKSLSTPNTYFGYSVAQHIVKSSKTAYILVGAPKASYASYNTSGAVYRCPITFNSNDCTQISVNFSPNSYATSDEYDQNNQKIENSGKFLKYGNLSVKQIFENQWFGSSIASTGSGSFMACAHRYTHQYNNSQKFEDIAMYGACYLFNNDFAQQYKYVPCLKFTADVNLLDHNYAYCLAGMSLYLEEATTLRSSARNEQKTFINMGLPTVLNFRGIPYVFEYPEVNKDRYMYATTRNTSLCHFKYNTNPVLVGDNVSTDCSYNRLWLSFSYSGVSTVMITNNRNADRSYIVANGAPRDALSGSVRLFKVFHSTSVGGRMDQLVTVLRGQQMGSYFGSSLTAVDVNGDSLKDLIVGAPYYNEKYEPNKGAIYVYMQKSLNEISSEVAFSYVGKPYSQFGTSISSIGDIDGDGYIDFAVGAPFEVNSNNRSTGAVYIFRGAKSAADIKLSQVLYAEEFAKRGQQVNGFGGSLSGGIDVDSNNYPDLVIGAAHSSTTFVVRTYPIVNVESSVQNMASLQDIDQARCTNQQRNCFNLTLCFNILENKRNVMLNAAQLPPVNFTFIADSKLKYPRVRFLRSNSPKYENKVNLNQAEAKCETIEVALNSNIDDYLTPITFSIESSFDLDYKSIQSRFNNMDEINRYPLVNPDLSKKDFAAKFKVECGDDLQCTTSISVSAKFDKLEQDINNVYLINFKGEDTLNLRVFIDNTKRPSEPSYGTLVHVNFDKRLDFKKIEKSAELWTQCRFNTTDSTHLICLIRSGVGVPFAANTKTDFLIKFGTSNLTSNSKENTVRMHVRLTTLSADVDTSDNQVVVLGRLVFKANLQLYSKNMPREVSYNDRVRGESSMKSLESIGPIIEHVYLVNNLGPFSIDYFQMRFHWPFELSPQPGHIHGKHLLYLIENPLKIPNNHPMSVVCDNEKHIANPLRLSETDTNRAKRSVLKNQIDMKNTFIDCFSNTARCHVITCNFTGELVKDDTIQIKFIARLWNSTLAEDYGHVERIQISSTAELILNDTISDRNAENDTVMRSSAFTIAHPSMASVVVDKAISVWIYIGSILAGVALLAICIFAFWMFGFFEHKKFSEHMEETVNLRDLNDGN